MAGPACKVIINNQTHGLSAALETILTNSDIYGVCQKLTDTKRLELLQRLADIDLAAYSGNPMEWSGNPMPAGGLAGIVVELEEVGLVTAEVWEILRKPPETIKLKK